MGIPAEARHPQEVCKGIEERRRETRVAAGGLLNRAFGAAEERWASNRSWRLVCAGQAALTAADIDNTRCKMSVKPELAFDVCWAGRTNGGRYRQQTVQR